MIDQTTEQNVYKSKYIHICIMYIIVLVIYSEDKYVWIITPNRYEIPLDSLSLF